MSESTAIGRQPELEQGDISGQDVELQHAGVRDVYGNNVTLMQSGVREVHATHLVVKQGGVQQAEATSVEVRQGGIGRVEAEQVHVSQGGIGLGRADTLTLGAGGSAAGLLAEQASVEQSSVQVLLARGEVTADQSALGAVVAPHVTLNHSNTVLLFAQHIEGDVKAVFGPAASAAFGAAFGTAAAVVWLLARRKR